MACSRPILLLLGSCRCCCISCCFSYRWATPASSAATISQLQDCRCSFAGSTRSLPPPRGDARCRPPRDDTVTQIPHQGVSKVLSSCFFPLRIDTLPTYCMYVPTLSSLCYLPPGSGGRVSQFISVPTIFVPCIVSYCRIFFSFRGCSMHSFIFSRSSFT